MAFLDNYTDGKTYFINVEEPFVVSDFWSPLLYVYAKLTFIKCGNLKINGINVNVAGNNNGRIIVRLGYLPGMLPRVEIEFNNGHNTTQSINFTDLTTNESFSFYGVYDSAHSEILGTGTFTETDYPFRKFLVDSLPALSQHQLDHLVQIRLCQCISEKNVVDKDYSAYIKNNRYFYGQLTEECDILNPSILIQYDYVAVSGVVQSSLDGLFDSNYAFIDKFKRSYFITKITNVRKGLWRIDLHVDVLNSFHTDIMLQSGFISRNENTYTSENVDDRRPLKDKKIVEYLTPPTSSGHTSRVNVTFDPYFDLEIRSYNKPFLAVNIFNDIESGIYQPTTSHSDINGTPIGTTLPKVNTSAFTNYKCVTYVMKWQEEKPIEKFIYDNSTLAGYVLSIIAFPFDLSFLEDTLSWTPPVKINDQFVPKVIGGVGTYNVMATSRKNTGYLILADFRLTPSHSGASSFLDYEPYNYYELWIPYCSWVKLNPRDVLNKWIIVYYIVDLQTGIGTAFVYNTTDQQLIYSSPCQLGVKIPLTTTNNDENTAIKQANSSNLALSLIGSVIAVGVGVASENPIAIAGGVLGGASAITNFVNKNAQTFDRANATLPDTLSSLYSPQKCWIKHTYVEEISITESVFAHTQGYVLKKYDALSGYTGYTEIESLHYTPSSQMYITSPEIDEIEELAKNGIIL